VMEPGWTDAIHEEDRTAVLEEWARAQERGRFCLEYRLRFRDGHYYYVRAASRRKRGILRDRWFGYIVRIDRDHTHRCEGVNCYCPASTKQWSTC
jgi:PAS domain-containing protein